MDEKESVRQRGRFFFLPGKPCSLCGLILFAFLLVSCQKTPHSSQSTDTVKPLEFDDSAIQRAAATALGQREGTMIVMEPRTGRIVATINPRLAFEQTFPPGSAIKPFTALTALRAGIVDQETRLQCKTTYRHDDFQVSCSHKKINNSFKLHHALAYSCNYFFSNLAERMNGESFFSMLDAFGLGNKTGVNANESAGQLKQSDWQISTAIGNDEKILVTPLQLLTAYVALLNGGHLLRPRSAEANNFTAQETRSININAAHRALLIEGLQGAAEFGTASDSGLAKLPYDVIGKTGTSGASNGFRTQGWFVSFLLRHKNEKNVAPEDLHLAVIVFLKRSHGSEAAGIASEFYHRLIFANNEAQTSPLSSNDGVKIRVDLVRENKTVAINLEDYLRGVLAAEASVETEMEALKTQAVVSRTFALKNLKRHEKDGYDFCSLTHCQRYASQLVEHNKAAILQAVDETAGQVLHDNRQQIADVYFHAACGGMTTNMTAVWGQPSPSYLQAVRDDYCTTMSHKSWTQNISSQDLIRALQTDERGNIGSHLNQIVITKRDVSGRAEIITLEGERRKQLRGWDFALIVNRVLGWNMLKSSRFEVSRAGSNFIFRGSGFGHGLGLCQEGAHVMARRGMNYREIIEHYLPGTKLTANNSVAVASGSSSPLLLISLPPFLLLQFINSSNEKIKTAPGDVRQAALASEHFRLRYPANLSQRDVDEVLRTFEAARNDLQRRLSSTSIRLPDNLLTQIIIHTSTGDYVVATGQPAWSAGATRGNIIHLQPVATLRKRGILGTTMRHELAHAVIESLSKIHPSRWLVEGLAIHFAGEGRMYAHSAGKLSREELEKKLATPSSASEMRTLYAQAYREIQVLRRQKGEAFVWKQALNP